MHRIVVLFALLGATFALAADPPDVRTHPLVRDHWSAVVAGTDPDRPAGTGSVLYLVSLAEDVFATCRVDMAGNPAVLRAYDFRVDYEHASPRPAAVGFDDDPRNVYVFNHRSFDDPEHMPVVHVYRWTSGVPEFARIGDHVSVRVPRHAGTCAVVDGRTFWIDAEGRLLSAAAGVRPCEGGSR